jgi:hypothetical protein
MDEIPSFLADLKTYNGYPVPFTQLWVDGKPDFRLEPFERFLIAFCHTRVAL